MNVSGVTAGWSGKYGDQQRFSASTSSDTSSVRQKRYDDNRVYPAGLSAVAQQAGALAKAPDQCSRFSDVPGTVSALTSLR